MIEREIAPNDIRIARKKADELGVLKNSIRKGKGNITAFIGEILVAREFGAVFVNNYDYDLEKNGKKIEVKTKSCTSKPRPYYNCSVADYNTSQDCDFYVFVRVLEDNSRGWILGGMSKDEFYEKAFFRRKGEIDEDACPRFPFKADCYNIKIRDLKQIKVKNDQPKTF